MNFRLKPSHSVAIFILLGSLWLNGCADTKWPAWMTGEPDSEVVNAPRAVGRPPSYGRKVWPKLSDIPEKPKDFSTPAERKKMLREMKKDRSDAETEKERILNDETDYASESTDKDESPSLGDF